MEFSEINCYQPSISATHRLRVIDNTQIANAPFRQYLSTPCFLYAPNYLLELNYRPLSLEYQLNNKDGQVKAIIDTPLDVLTFQTNFQKHIQNRPVTLEITDEFGQSEIVHNYKAVNFTKVATPDRQAFKSFELIFVPAKLKPQKTFLEYKPIIKEVIASPSATSPFGQSSTDVLINLHDFCEISLFTFGYSTTYNISEGILNPLTPKNIIRSLTNGTYYFFAINTACPKYYQYIKGTILNGNISFDTDTTTQNTNIFSVDGDQSNNNFDGSIDGDITTN